jgi:hypothetical protein
MQYYKDTSNKIHCLESSIYAYLLPPGCIPITETEALASVVPSLADIKSAKIQAIIAERNRRKFGGFAVTVEGNTKWFHSDADSRTQQLGLVALGNDIPSELLWTTMDGSTVTMTSTVANAILRAAAIADTTNFAIAKQHIEAMEASADPANYDHSQGWVQIYGE